MPGIPYGIIVMTGSSDYRVHRLINSPLATPEHVGCGENMRSFPPTRELGNEKPCTVLNPLSWELVYHSPSGQLVGISEETG